MDRRYEVLAAIDQYMLTELSSKPEAHCCCLLAVDPWDRQMDGHRNVTQTLTSRSWQHICRWHLSAASECLCNGTV